MNHIVKYNKPRAGSGAVSASGAGIALSSLAGLLTQQQLATILEGYLLKETFDDLFVKESDGHGGYRIKAKYALYSNQYLSCLGNNPDAGTVELGATTLGGLNNVVAAADESSAAAKVLVREAGASEWSLRNLSDIVGLDTAALAAYLTNNHYAKTSDIPSLAGYLQKAQADSLYQPIGDYATSADLSSAVTSLTAMVSGKLDASVFDDLFVKEADGKGGYRIKARYALYSNQYLSCLGNNPDAGTVAAGATTLGGLDNVVAAADEATAAAKVLVREAGSASWTLKNLSDIVGLDTAALSTYLSNNGYAKQSWVEAKGYLTQHQSLAGYATEAWVQAQGYLTAITKAQVEAVLTGNIATHTHSQYLTSTLAAQTYQPKGDYATSSALSSAVSALNTAIGKKLDAATFDDLFVKESDGKGGYRIRAKYALYSNQYLSCLGNNPDAGTATGGGVDLDAVQAYLTQQGYATQAWVQAQGYLKAADLSAYALADNAYLKTQQNRKGNAHTVASLTAVANSSDSWVNNYSFSLVNNNNALNFYVGGEQNERQALIQSGHNSNGYAQVLGALHLNKLGGAVYINNSLALNAANVGSYAVTLDTAQTITGVKTLGTRVSTSTGNIDRLIIVPYKHTAGPWKINSYDDSSEAWLRFMYGPTETITFSNNGEFFANAIRKRGGTSSQFLMADGTVRDEVYFRHAAGSVPTAYVDLTAYTANASGYANYQSGVYTIGRGSHSELLVNFAYNAGSTSALQLYTSYSDSEPLKFRKTIDANRVSGPWRTILTELNVGSYALTPSNYAATLDARYVNKTGDTMTGRLAIITGQSECGIRFGGTTTSDDFVGRYGDYVSLFNHVGRSELKLRDSGVAELTNQVKVINNGRTLSLGSNNADWCHYETDAPSGHWFNSKLSVRGEIYAGAYFNQLVWHAGNDGSGSGLDADMLDGYHETAFVRSWWTDSPGYDCASYNSRPLISFTYGKNAPFTGAFIDVVTKGYGFYLGTSYNSNGPLFYRRHGVSNDGGMGTWQQLARIGDNVASATRLQGTYSLWGQSFYGNNVSGNMTGVGTINTASAPINTIYANDWYRSIGATGWYNQTYGGGWYMDNSTWIRAYNKPVNIAYATNEGANGYGVGLRCYHASHTSVEVQGGSYTMGLGCHSDGSWHWWRGTASGKSYVMQYNGSTWAFTGIIKSSTGMWSDGYMSCLGQNTGSDARLKNVLGAAAIPIEVLLGAPAVRFAWNASAPQAMVGRVAVGTIAQYWQEHLPEVVGEMYNGRLGVNYGALGWIAVHSLARYAYDGLTDHERRIKTLEAENKELKNRIAELERRKVA